MIDSVARRMRAYLAVSHGKAHTPLLVLAVFALGLVLWASGEGVLYTAARRVGYGVCHQLPNHSYTAWGMPLPLCARCTGQYLGALVMLGYVMWAGGARVRRFPSPSALGVAGVLLVVWAADGLNSFLEFLGLPHLYAPRNFLRLVTGMGEGVAVMALFWPAFAQATWPPREGERLHGRDLLKALAVAYALALVVHVGNAWIRYTLGLLSAFAVLLLMAMVFSVFLRLLTRRIGTGERGWETTLFLVLGTAMAIGAILGVGALRDLLPHVVE